MLAMDCPATFAPGYFPDTNLNLIIWTNYKIIFIRDVEFAMFGFQMKKL